MAAETHEGTAVPAESAGLPQMNADTFPSQWFWLAVTFGLLMMAVKKTVLPKLAGGIEGRKAKIGGDLAGAEAARKKAADTLAAYDATLAQARANALANAGESRKKLTAEIDALKAEAEAKAQAASAAGEARIAGEREKAAGMVRGAAAQAASDIVERLIGVKVGADEADKAIAGERA